jgi:hypothetical protein
MPISIVLLICFDLHLLTHSNLNGVQYLILRKWAPDLAETVKDLQRVEALLVGEVDDAVDAVVLDHLQHHVHLVRAVVHGRELRRAELVSLEGDAASM